MTSIGPRAVFDCVVLLQSASSRKGPAFACFQLVQTGRLSIVVSDETIAEITDVLHRPELQRKFKTLTPEVADAFVSELKNRAEMMAEVPREFV